MIFRLTSYDFVRFPSLTEIFCHLAYHWIIANGGEQVRLMKVRALELLDSQYIVRL